MGETDLMITRRFYVSLLLKRWIMFKNLSGVALSDLMTVERARRKRVLVLLGPELEWLCPFCSSLYAIPTLVASLSAILALFPLTTIFPIIRVYSRILVPFIPEIIPDSFLFLFSPEYSRNNIRKPTGHMVPGIRGLWE